MVPAGSKAESLSSVNHTTKTIHHHHHQNHLHHKQCNYSIFWNDNIEKFLAVHTIFFENIYLLKGL